MFETEDIYPLCVEILLLADSESKNKREEPATGKSIN